MPLNRPAQALTPGPRGVSDARRWATQVLTEIQRPELVESACISVSEVITNALLHAEQPVSVRLRGTREHPRIEVRDGSREPPDLPDLESEPEDDVLLTFGRGLSIVARVSSAWGAEIEEDGKIVWFVPQVELADGPGVQGLITELQPMLREDPPEVDDPVEVTLIGLPLPEMKLNRMHLRELRRELRLLALGHEATYPLAASLSRFFTDLDVTFWRGHARRQPRLGPARRRRRSRPHHHDPAPLGRRLPALHRAARARRRLLPPGAVADPGPHARPGRLPDLDVRRVRAPGARRDADALAAAEPRRETAPERLVTRPAAVTLVAVAIGGAAGGTLRWWLGDVVPDGHGFPWTTFAINVTGALALALLPAVAAVRTRPVLTAGLGPGLLGGYTTLSTYAEQGRALLADGRAGLAAAYLLGTLAACLVAVTLAGRLSSRPAQRLFADEEGNE